MRTPRNNRVAALLVFIVLAASCGSTQISETISASTSDPNQTQTTDDQLLVSCNGPSRPVTAYSNAVPLAEAELPAVVSELAAFTSAGEGSGWPQSGWLVLEEEGADVTLLHVDGDAVIFVTFTPADNGYRFQGSVSGECKLEVAVPDNMSLVDWVLDPDWDSPTATSTEIRVLTTERSCTGGNLPGNRLLPPQLVESDTAVHLSFLAEPLSGDQPCPGNPSTPVTVQLADPLGTRTLVDARALDITVAELVNAS